MEILRFENLTKTYGEGENKVEALKKYKFINKQRRICSDNRSIRFW
ncbi:hypothetical protein GCM10008904_15280 [Paraclostridium ghonii]|uniref:Uncharacterized protein n=1 Tax=Paraclostridium ghonii TaxID=29358 RepID=A0ABU0MZM2_9FIRM|nr:hypothetical protein [Paeniclostridium ghonii]